MKHKDLRKLRLSSIWFNFSIDIMEWLNLNTDIMGWLNLNTDTLCEHKQRSPIEQSEFPTLHQQIYMHHRLHQIQKAGVWKQLDWRRDYKAAGNTLYTNKATPHSLIP